MEQCSKGPQVGINLPPRVCVLSSATAAWTRDRTAVYWRYRTKNQMRSFLSDHTSPHAFINQFIFPSSFIFDNYEIPLPMEILSYCHRNMSRHFGGEKIQNWIKVNCHCWSFSDHHFLLNPFACGAFNRHSRTFQNIPEHCRTLQNIAEHSRTLQNIPEGPFRTTSLRPCNMWLSAASLQEAFVVLCLSMDCYSEMRCTRSSGRPLADGACDSRLDGCDTYSIWREDLQRYTEDLFI